MKIYIKILSLVIEFYNNYLYIELRNKGGGKAMTDSKGWDWKQLEGERKKLWQEPAIEYYYIAERWKNEGFKTALDLGSGLGRHAIALSKDGFKVSAFDISEDGMEELKKVSREENLDIDTKIGDMINLPYNDEEFDSIFCYNVVSHQDTSGVKKVIEEIKRVLKPEGECFLTLQSKSTWGFKQDWPVIDENTKLKMVPGEEYKVPHFYADPDLIRELFKDFSIISLRHIENFWKKEDGYTSSFHYHVLIKKDK